MAPFMSFFKGPFALWGCHCTGPVKHLDEKLLENKFYPFQVQQPKVFVMEYYKDIIWKGSLLFVVSLVTSILYFRGRQSFQNFTLFFVAGMLIGLWMVVSNIYRRRLIINHIKNTYQFFIKGRLWHEGPIHQIYVRLVAQADAHGKLFYSLIINGYRLEAIILANLTDKFEEINVLGQRIARNLNLNYFDFEDISVHHIIRHHPPEDDKEEEDEEEGLEMV